MKDLYTFVLEYGGGTYVSQVAESSAAKALERWIDGFDLHRQKAYSRFFEPQFHKKLKESLDVDLLVPIENVVNVWSWGAFMLDKPSTLTLIKTVTE